MGQASLKRAEKLREEGKIQEAINVLQQLVDQEPNNKEYQWKLGEAYLEGSPKSKAEAAFAKAIKLDEEKDSGLMRLYAEALHFNHKFDEALTWYKKADPFFKDKGYTLRSIKQCESGKKLMARPVKFSINNLGRVVNSSFPEYLPYLTADENKMFFTSRRPGNTGGKLAADDFYTEDVFVSYRVNNSWTTPKLLGAPVNTPDNDACVGIDQYATTMFIYRGVNGGDLFISKWDGKNWGSPKAFEHNSPGFESSACLSPDGKQLFFVSDKYGNKDIFICDRTENGWSSPKKLLGGVNTHLDEESPFLHPDGKTLYYSSKGHNSMGGYDIMRIELKGIFGQGAPENLGYPLNTAGDDLFFTLSADGRTGYFASERDGGLGHADLYEVKMPVAPKKPELTILRGTITDELTGKPTSATIKVLDNIANEVITEIESDATTGKYTLTLPSGKNYGITVTKNKRLFYSENVTTKTGTQLMVIDKDIKVQILRTGASVTLKNCFYDLNKSTLHPSSYAELDLVAAVLKEAPEVTIEVSGHTDNTGSEAINKELSLARANSVRNYLVSKGVPPSMLIAKGYSSSKPIATNTTDEGRALNRRTEMTVVQVRK